MRQLALDVRLDDHAVFASFHRGPNALLVASLEEMAAGRGLPVAWIWGAAGSGRSHLLQASVARAHERGASTAYLPLAAIVASPATVLDGLDRFDLVAIDDVGAVAGNAEWERALFRLYEGLGARGGRLAAAAHSPPGQAGLALPDLASRLAAGAVFRLEQLSDADRLSALQRRAEWRGLTLPDDTAQFLLARVERDAASLFGLLDRLDRAALVAQRRLTIPFVKSVLASGS
jgi:DnaA family protein